ncbi:MAG: hypothetical protein KBC81_03880 [Candidatus Pacebacteria bacterium]|nr:hypothetical protein [Candidatus Paceibacterota bacterium]
MECNEMVYIEVRMRSQGGAPRSSGPYASKRDAANSLEEKGWMYAGSTYWVPAKGMNPYELSAEIVPLEKLLPDPLFNPQDFSLMVAGRML